MSKAKMQAAKELIREKRYEDARAILRDIDHPTAREWLQKINRIAPERKRKMPRKAVAILSLIVLIVVLVIVVLNARYQTQLERDRFIAQLHLEDACRWAADGEITSRQCQKYAEDVMAEHAPIVMRCDRENASLERFTECLWETGILD